MEVFAHFDVLDHLTGSRIAEGHKASFCLEDNHCTGVDPKYDCENYGDQGITAGCKDIYYYNVDCQWLDVTELPLGTYTFKMSINPEYKVNMRTQIFFFSHALRKMLNSLFRVPLLPCAQEARSQFASLMATFHARKKFFRGDAGARNEKKEFNVLMLLSLLYFPRFPSKISKTTLPSAP